MTIAYFCILVASLLPIMWVGIAKFYMGFNLEKNSNPRIHLANGSGVVQRANWAEMNSWEAFAPFAAAVLIAVELGVSQFKIDSCAIIFIASRLSYGVCYICNWPILRSLVWAIGMAAVLYLYVLAW